MENRKKELKKQYLQMKPEMGVFMVRNRLTNQCFVDASPDIKSVFNRIDFQLIRGMHPCAQLQKDWNELGKENFSFEVADRLDYSQDESKTDYRDDLAVLKKIWLEKLAQETGMKFYSI